MRPTHERAPHAKGPAPSFDDFVQLTGGAVLIKRRQAAQLLSMSLDTFERHVQPEIRLVRRGARLKLVPVAELVAWIEANASRVLDGS